MFSKKNEFITKKIYKPNKVDIFRIKIYDVNDSWIISITINNQRKSDKFDALKYIVKKQKKK